MTTHKTISKTGFGFDAIMENPGHSGFRDWWNDKSYFALTRDDVEEMFSSPEDVTAEIAGSFARWSSPDHAEAA